MNTKYRINECFEQKTLQEYLEWLHLGKARMSEFVNKKAFTLNGNLASLNTILAKDDILTLDIDEQIDYIPDCKKLDIIYEDDYLLIVNKPAHILVHPDDKKKQGTMCNIVAYYYHNRGWSYNIRYAHRLDMDTTGILIFVKDPLTLAKIDEMISTHELKRTYLCLAKGKFSSKQGEIDAPIGEDRHHQQRKRVSKTGKPAQTMYKVLKEFKGYSLVEATLKTGRTHQIRVHLSSIGHPLLGDTLYGNEDNQASRVMLHSYQVSFIHPITLKEIHLTKAVPYDMKQFL